MTSVDIVVPVRNEAQNLARFVDELGALALPDEASLRIIFVEDSSTDNTVEVLRELAKNKTNVAFASIKNPYGQGHATYFGVGLSDADAVITMDVDGSHPVAAIVEMIDAYLGGATIVQCVRRKGIDRGAVRKMGASGFEIATRLISGCDITWQNVHYRLMTKALANQIFGKSRYWRTGRFRLPSDANINLAMVDIDMPERAQGESKYNFSRLASIAIDTILSLMSPGRLFFFAMIATIIAVYLLKINEVATAGIAFMGIGFIWRYFHILSGRSKSIIQVVESENIYLMK